MLICCSFSNWLLGYLVNWLTGLVSEQASVCLGVMGVGNGIGKGEGGGKKPFLKLEESD